MDRFISSYH